MTSRSDRTAGDPAAKAAGISNVRAGSTPPQSCGPLDAARRFTQRDQTDRRTQGAYSAAGITRTIDNCGRSRLSGSEPGQRRQGQCRANRLRQAETTPFLWLNLGSGPGLPGSTLMGSATRSVRSGRLCLSDDPGRDRNTSGACRAGMVPASRQELRKCPSQTLTPSPSASPPP